MDTNNSQQLGINILSLLDLQFREDQKRRESNEIYEASDRIEVVEEPNEVIEKPQHDKNNNLGGQQQ